MNEQYLSSLSADTRREEWVASARRVVVKVGSAVIAAKGKLRPKVIADLAYEVSVLQHQGVEVVMVVSGAVAAGFAGLGHSSPPQSVVGRQAAASVGQYKLMTVFAKAFHRHRVEVAQLLMTEGDIFNPRRFLSARHTLHMLIRSGVVPIINENDALADDERQIGDNDHLAAWVTNVVSADLLVLLSRVKGVCRKGTGEDIVDRVTCDTSLESFVTDEKSETGVGGMGAKVAAARCAGRWGVPVVIAGGNEPGVLAALMRGEPVGTLFEPPSRSESARAYWMALQAQSHGSLQVDMEGKRRLQGGVGLLPSHVTTVSGAFGIGARVDIIDETGQLIACGLTAYDADEIRKMQGHPGSALGRTLGFEYARDVVGVDELVLCSNANPKIQAEVTGV